MANKQTTETPETEYAPNTAALIQKTMDDLCARIADHPKTSFAVRIARAYRAGVPQESLQAALGYIQAAVDDAQAALDRAVAAPVNKKKQEPVEVPSRANLF